MEISWENMREPSLGSGIDVLGRFSCPSRPVPHTVSWTCCRLTTVFSLLLLLFLLLQVKVCRIFYLAGSGQ